MPADYSIYFLDESLITISGGGQLDGVTQGNGSHLQDLFITLDSNAWEAVEISDDDANFQDSDSSQRLFGDQTIAGTTYPDNTVVEAEYGLTLTDGTNTWQVVGFNFNQDSPAFGTVEGLAFIGEAGEFPPVGVPLQVVSTFEGPSFAAEDYATPICVVSGTMIRTPNGQRAVEDIVAGDLVVTRDHGVRAVQWTGARRFAARGNCTPVRFETGALGNTAPLVVSQQHRMLVTGWQAELLFGEDEVLIPAVHLLNDTTVRLQRGGTVQYHHLLLDRHAVIETNGAWSESFHPGAQALKDVARDAYAELIALFPELAKQVSETEPPCGYPIMKRHEGTLIHLG